MELHFSVVSELLSAEVTLEGSLARVEADVDLEPVTVSVLARAVAAHHRRFHLTQTKKKINFKQNFVLFFRFENKYLKKKIKNDCVLVFNFLSTLMLAPQKSID